MSTKLVLCIDGGASSTRLAFIQLNNKKFIKSYKCGPTYFYKDNKNGVLNLHKVLASNKLLPHTVGIVMGIAGIDTSKDLSESRKIYKSYFSKLTKKATIDIVNDIELTFSFCDSKSRLKIAIIAGTGSNCIGKYNNKKAKAGGLGHLLTDQGSGYYIGYNALRKVVECMDFRGEDTILAPLIMKKFGTENLSKLKDYTSSKDFGKKEVASLTPTVVFAASKGDKTAKQILESASNELVKHVLAVDTHLDTNGNPQTSIVCTGSIYKIPQIRSHFNTQVKSYFKSATITYPDKPPIFGAFLYYLRKYGI